MRGNMKQQIKLTLDELCTLAVERLIDKGNLNNTSTYVDWHFDTWRLKDGYVIVSQEG